MARNACLFISFTFISCLLIPIVQASTPHSIVNFDGSLDDWPQDSHMSTDNGLDFHMTWNETHLFFGLEGTEFSSQWGGGSDFFIYFNTTTGGSPVANAFGTSQTLPFDADFCLQVEDSTYHTLQTFDGSQWTDVGTRNGESNTFPGESYIGWYDENNGQSNDISEISITWEALNEPTSIEIIGWGQYQNEGHVWSSFPSENPAQENGGETFTHFWRIEDRNVSIEPSSLIPQQQVEPAGKLDTALNLAIIFHQHQPYYKNKLTNTFEMPWVRVHAMTEYVDSPGILSQYPDTKVTYNLVPSFIEQLVEYHELGTYDVHTEFASRYWPVDQSGVVTDYPNATDLELHTMQFQSFWNSGWIYNVSADDSELGWLEPSSRKYSQLYDMTKHNLKPDTIMDDTLLSPQDFLDLQVLWYLYQFSPDYVLGEYADIEETVAAGRPAHYNASLKSLYQQVGGYSPEDLSLVLEVQHQHMANVLPMYAELAAEGQVELTTTPYYHPIMPLLMMDGWTFEDGIRVNKQAWPADVQTHLTTGMDLFEEQLGFRPSGMWPSEQSVSPDMVQPVADVGIEWMVTDELNLAESTIADGSYVDTSLASNLATPWMVSGVDGDEVATIFRDRVISDRIAFQYGSMTPEAAVTDFIDYIDGVRQALLDEGKDPSDHLLTVALDGENWMFMSEFQHYDGARPFMHEWYSRLATHPSILTTTPGEFLQKNLTLPKIETVGTGSWIDGTLSTWAGEEEESLGWQRLVEARQTLVAFEEENPNHPGLDAAWESLYISEGSDWFWWYGLDQDSGYDELWDTLYKVHLSNIYKAIGVDLPPYLQEVWTNPSQPLLPYAGVIEPLIDGVALPGEWDGAAKYEASVDGGDFDIDSFYLGYDASNVYVRIDAPSPQEIDLLNKTSVPDLSIYFMQANANNFNEVGTNFRTYFGQEILGFPAKKMVSFDYTQLWEDGRSKWNVFDAQGKVGGSERWTLSSTSALGGCAADGVYEFQIPWSELGLSPRYSTRIKVVSSWADSLSYGDGVEMEMAPPAPAEMVLPDLEEWVVLLQSEDAIGDANGDGNYLPPLSGDFSVAGEADDVMDLWDIHSVKISQSAWNARFELNFGAMTDYWSLANGFSHQIIQIYVDQGETSFGNVEMLEGANALVHEEWAWEVAISATGEPGAVKSVQAETGSTSSKGIEVFGDVNTNNVTLTISKSVIGPDVSTYRYVIVVGSQDGFGPGKWRDVDAQAKTWRLGGGADPSTEDGQDYDPNILDVMLDSSATTSGFQSEMLGNFSVSELRYATLTGIEIPDVTQQIYGLKVLQTTSSGAILEWSTTQPEASVIVCENANGTQYSFNETELSPSGSQALTHSVLVSGLDAGTNYNCEVSVLSDSEIIATVAFETGIVEDITPPEILNVQAAVLEDGRVKFSWYTSEITTEKVHIFQTEDSTESFIELNGDEVAAKKSHEISTSEAVSVGQWWYVVLASDPSGNGNQSAMYSFIVEENTANENEESNQNEEQSEEKEEDTIKNQDDVSDDAKGLADLVSDPMAQVLLLLVALAVIIALMRSRKHGLDYSSPDGFTEVDALFDDNSEDEDVSINEENQSESNP